MCTKEVLAGHATVIPSRKTPFSSDHGRQIGLGQINIRWVTTWEYLVL